MGTGPGARQPGLLCCCAVFAALQADARAVVISTAVEDLGIAANKIPATHIILHAEVSGLVRALCGCAPAVCHRMA